MFNVDFLEKGLVIVSSPHFDYDFSRKYFSCCILLADEISLPDCFYFLRYWAICVWQLFFFPDCYVITFKTNLSLLIKPFFYLTKRPRQKFKYLENEKRKLSQTLECAFKFTNKESVTIRAFVFSRLKKQVPKLSSRLSYNQDTDYR